MLRRVAHVGVEFREQPAQKFRRRARPGAIHQPDKPRLFVFLTAGVDRFDYSIGEDDEPVVRAQLARARLMYCLWQNSQRDSPCLEPLDGSGALPENRRVVSGVDVDDVAGHRIKFRYECRREADAALAIGAGIAIQPHDQFRERDRAMRRLRLGGSKACVNSLGK